MITNGPRFQQIVQDHNFEVGQSSEDRVIRDETCCCRDDGGGRLNRIGRSEVEFCPDLGSAIGDLQARMDPFQMRVGR